MSRIQVSGCRLHYEEWGEGIPLVCLHGGMGIDSSYMDCAALRALAGHGIRVILFDQRGHGRSGRTGEVTYTHATWASDVRDLASGLGLTRFALMGHSYGGFIALEFALRHADLLSHLILAGTSAGPVDAAGFARVGSDPELKEALRHRWPAFFAGEEKHWPVFDGLRFSSAAYSAACLRELPRYDLSDWVQELKVPALMVAGTEDPYAVAMKAMAARMKSARLELMEGTGHLPFLEAPEEFTGILSSFLVES